MSVTIRELSRRCGLSTSAVSKALNNYPDVSEETRQRVLKMAQEMGYFPNALARGLKTNHTYNLGVVLDGEMRDTLLHSFFILILNGFRKQADDLGYDITLIGRNTGSRKLSYLNHCRYRNVDGTCVMCEYFEHPQIIELAADPLPLVTIDHPFPGRHCIFSDNEAGMRALLRYILSMGHRRIAIVHGTGAAVTTVRLNAFFTCMREAGLSQPEEYIVAGHYHDAAHCFDAVRQLLALPDRPTCILVPDDYSALGGIEAIKSAGLRIPEDISIAGYDGIPIIQNIRPRLTTLRQDGEELGRLAAVRLIERIEHGAAPQEKPDVVTGTLLEGETVARVNP